jgi:predicted RNA-binding Zn ribbon-like protein
MKNVSVASTSARPAASSAVPANHDCILFFYDTLRSGRRQWCSMAGCGNRAKARRHYARSHGADPA